MKMAALPEKGRGELGVHGPKKKTMSIQRARFFPGGV